LENGKGKAQKNFFENCGIKETKRTLWVRGFIATNQLIHPTRNYSQSIVLFTKVTFAFPKDYDKFMGGIT